MENNDKTYFRCYNVSLKKFYLVLSETDFYCSHFKLSIQNGYCRPIIRNSDKSYVDVKEIRRSYC